MPTPTPTSALHRPAPRPAAVGLIALAAMAFGGCDGSDGVVAAAPQVADSAGVAVVTYPSSALPAAPAWRVDPAAALSLPGEFHTIVGVARLPDGTLVVADRGSSEIRYFDGAGARLATAGRSGEGPGEYRLIAWMDRWQGDSVAVFDLGSRRVTLLDDGGELVRSIGFALTEAIPFAAPSGLFADGTIIATGISQVPPEGPGTGRQHHPIPVYSFAADGTRPYTTGISMRSDAWYEPAGGGGFTFVTPPFAQEDLVRVGPDRILHASRASGELRLHRADGTLTRIVRGAAGPVVPVTAELRSAEIERLLDGSDDPELRRLHEGMDVPANLPAFTTVRTDRLGHLWIRDYRRPGTPDDAPATWRVLDPDGQPAGQLELPARFTPHDIGADYIFGVQRDALDVQTPVLLPLVRGG